MSSQNRLLERAISLYQTGDCETARRLLLGILRKDPNNQIAWLHYAETFPSLGERLAIYQKVLAKHPNMDQVRQAYEQVYYNPPVVVPVSGGATLPMQPGSAFNGAAKPAARMSTTASRQNSPTWMFLAALVIFTLIMGVLGTSLLYREQAQATGSQIAALELKTRNMQTVIDQLTIELDRARQASLTEKGLHDLKVAQFNELQKKYNEVNQTYAALQQQSNALTVESQKLKDENQALKASYSSLEGKYADLQKRYDNSEAELNNLKKLKLVPPYMTVHDGDVNMVFLKMDKKTLLTWRMPYETLEKDILQGNENPAWNWLNPPKITIKSNWGDEYQVADVHPYIEPAVFSSNIKALYNDTQKQAGSQAAHDEAFIREVQNIVVQLASNNRDYGIETPRYPLETLFAGGGDSVDIAILYTSMIKAAPTFWSIKLIYMNTNSPNVVVNPNHVLVLINTGSNIYLVDPGNPKEIFPYPAGGVQGYSIDV